MRDLTNTPTDQGDQTDAMRIQSETQRLSNSPALNDHGMSLTQRDQIHDAKVKGQSGPVFTLPNVAIHAHVLPTGKVLMWGRRDNPTDSMGLQDSLIETG
jgi:hypothetical protein